MRVSRVVMYDVPLIDFKLFGSQLTLQDAADHHVTCNKREYCVSGCMLTLVRSEWLYCADCMCRLAQVLAEHMNVPVVKSDMILEGGSVHTDGQGCACRCFLLVSSAATGIHVFVPAMSYPLRHMVMTCVPLREILPWMSNKAYSK